MGNYGLDYNESLKLSLFSKIEVKLEILDTYCTSEVIFPVVSIFEYFISKKNSKPIYNWCCLSNKCGIRVHSLRTRASEFHSRIEIGAAPGNSGNLRPDTFASQFYRRPNPTPCQRNLRIHNDLRK